MRPWHIPMRHYLIKRHLTIAVLNYIVSSTRARCPAVFLFYVDVLPPPSLGRHGQFSVVLKMEHWVQNNPIFKFIKKQESEMRDQEENWQLEEDVSISTLGQVQVHRTWTLSSRKISLPLAHKERQNSSHSCGYWMTCVKPKDCGILGQWCSSSFFS